MKPIEPQTMLPIAAKRKKMTTMKTRPIQSITTLLFLYNVGLLHAQIQFEQVLPLPPAPQNVVNFERVAESALGFADVDGDSDQDVVITGRNVSGDAVSNLYINDGFGNYTQMESAHLESVKQGAIAFADVNGDGTQDLAIAGLNVENLPVTKLYSNNGNGIFTLILETPFDDVANGTIAFADVDLDNDQDLFMTGQNNNNQKIAKLYLNNGTGIFSLSQESVFEGVWRSDAVFADVDGDNDPDIIILGSNMFSEKVTHIYINQGGIFSLLENSPFENVATGSINVADVNGDNHPDVLIIGVNGTNQEVAKLYANDGDGNFTLIPETPFIGARGGGSSCAFADADGDGDQDVFITGRVGCCSQVSNLYFNNGDDNFILATTTSFAVVESGSIGFADIDGDNDQDLLVTGFVGPSFSVRPSSNLYINVGDGNYSVTSTSPFVGLMLSSSAFADMDNDNDQDILISGQTITNEIVIALFANDGIGNYSLVPSTPFEAIQEGDIAFADVDGDNDQDLLITGLNASGARVSKLYANQGNGAYSLVSNTPFVGVYVSSIAFKDVDGDSDQDVLITGLSDTNGIARLYMNDGFGNFSLAVGTPFVGVYESDIAFADVDGDGDPDVLITGQIFVNQPTVNLYSNDGNGIFTLIPGVPFEALSSGTISFADIDGDSDQDVLLTGRNNLDQASTKLYSNNGGGTYSLIPSAVLEGFSRGATAFADVDGDNDMDVLFTGQNSSDQPNTKLYMNDGNGGFNLIPEIPFEKVDIGSISFLDVDGDSDQDLFITGKSLFFEAIAKLYRNVSTNPCSITASCSPYTLTLSPSGTATLTPDDVNNGSIVSCGAPILSLSQINFDATHIGENIVILTVEDENGNTDTCQAVVTVLPNPESCRYFLSNYNAQGGSDVYEMFIDEDAFSASLNHLVSVPQRVNLSYNNAANLLYLGRENNSTFQTINPDDGSLSLPGGVSVNLSGFTGAAFGPDGMLYAASQTSGAIYRFNPSNFTGSLFSSALVNGGDIDFDTDGKLVLVSRNPARAYFVNQGAPNTIIGPVPNTVSGLARTGDGNFLLSVAGYNKLILGSTDDGDLGVRFDLLLNGAPFTPGNGDLASGCPVPTGEMVVMAAPNLSENAVNAHAVLSSQPNPTDGISVVRFTTEKGTRATLEVYDMNGRNISTLFNQVANAGQEYRIDFDGSALPNGVYIYRLTTENEVVVEKFMIAR